MPARLRSRSATSSTGSSAWRSALRQICDDRLGLHDGVVHVIKRTVQEEGDDVDRDTVKTAIRTHIAEAVANKELTRSQSYIGAETNDGSLERIFDWAIGRGYAIQFIQRSKNPSFSEAIEQLEDIAEDRKPGKHSLSDYAFTAACVGFSQCPAKMSLDDMLTSVQVATHDRLSTSI